MQASVYNFNKKGPWHRCFPVNFMIFLRTSILQNNSWELLLRRKQLNLNRNRNQLKNVFLLISSLIYERRTFLCSIYVVGCFLCKVQHRNTIAQKMKFSIKDFFSKCDQISSILRIWSHLLKKSLMENFIFCEVHFSH